MQVPEITFTTIYEGEARWPSFKRKIDDHREPDGAEAVSRALLPSAEGAGRAGAGPERLPTCPPHLNPPAAAEWRRIAKALQRAGVLTTFDRAALAAYCQA